MEGRHLSSKLADGYRVILFPLGAPPEHLRTGLEALRRELEEVGAPAELLPDAERGRERLSETTMSTIGALVIALGQQEDAAHALTEILALRDQQWPEL
ncbi:MAG: hypothetical protein K6U87_12470, partial [Firmicutes bacterium]|nr:hypothetical protein [Bacillota bacterium]